MAWYLKDREITGYNGPLFIGETEDAALEFLQLNAFLSLDEAMQLCIDGKVYSERQTWDQAEADRLDTGWH